MSTTATTPAPTPAPVAPAKLAGPVTPAIPAAQTASQPQVPPPAKPLPKPAATIEDALRKTRQEVFKNEGEGTVDPSTADALTKQTETVAAKKPEVPVAAESKPAPVAADKDPFEHITAPEGMTEKSLTGWKALKKEASEKVSAAEKKYNDALAQLETYKKATPADTAEAARLKEELKQAQDKLSVLDYKSSDDYRKRFDEPKKTALKKASEIMGYQPDPKSVDLARLLDKPLKDFNAEVSEITKDMNGMDAQTVQASLRQAYELSGGEKDALSRSGELKAQIEAKNAAAARQAFERTRDDIKAKVPILQIPEGASEETIAEFSEYNQSVAAALTEAESNSFGKISEADVARISHEAAMLKPMSKLFRSIESKYKTVTKLNQELSAELAAIKKGKNPGQFTESGSPQAQPTQNRNSKTPDFAAAAREVGLR